MNGTIEFIFIILDILEVLHGQKLGNFIKKTLQWYVKGEFSLKFLFLSAIIIKIMFAYQLSIDNF